MHRRSMLKGLAATGLLASAPALAQTPRPGRWLKLETANFTIYTAESEQKARAEAAALEAFHVLLGRLSRVPAQSSRRRLPVYFAATTRDFELTSPGMSRHVGGYYTNALEEVRAVVAASRSDERQADVHKMARAFDSRTVLFHEYVHHFQRASMRWAYPPWYAEGFAEFLSTAMFSDAGCAIGKPIQNRAVWLASGQWLPIEKLLDRPANLTSDQTSLFYAQAWLATHMIMLQPGLAASLDAYVKALTAGGGFLEAFQPAFGMTPAEFDRKLRDYKRTGLQVRNVPDARIDTSAAVRVERLPAAADDLLMPTAFVRQAAGGKPDADHENALRIIREQARKHAGDPYAVRSLATAEIWLGDLPAARPLLDGLLASQPDDAETHHLSGLCDLRMGRAAGDASLVARSALGFATAHRLDNSRAASLFHYCLAKAQGADGFNDHVMEVLVEAWQLAPQVTPISVVLAQALLHKARYDEAAVVLRPLTMNAHGSRNPLIDRLLAAAVAKQAPSGDDADAPAGDD